MADVVAQRGRHAGLDVASPALLGKRHTAIVSVRMRGRAGAVLAAMMMVAVSPARPASAEAPEPPPAAAPAEPPSEPKDGSKPKTLWDEFKLFSYAEMGATFNLHGGSKGVPDATSTGWTNAQRDYDIYQGYTFNMAELSIKRDPDEAFPFGMGLVMTAGMDAQKNHSIGIFRSEDDAFPFRNTPWFDLQEAFVTARIPVA